MTKPRYQLLIEVQHQADDPDGVRRLRMALKRLLRSFGLRCVSVVPEPSVAIVDQEDAAAELVVLRPIPPGGGSV